MRHLCRLMILFIFPVVLFSQINQDTIYVWDNDRGQSRQFYPSVGCTNTRGFICWQDSRDNDWNIWRTYRNWVGALMGVDRCISPDNGGYRQQTRVDAEGNPSTGVVYTWEDSLYRPTPAPTRIMAAIYNQAPFEVFSNTMSHKNPSVSCANNGDFVISFTSWSTTTSAIRARRYNASGVLQQSYSLWTNDLLRQWAPVSRIAFCDSGFVVVYEDSTAANARSIFLHYYSRTGTTPIVSRLKISNASSTETYNEYAPAVAVNSSGYVVAVWEDARNGMVNPDIMYRIFQMRPGASSLDSIATGVVYNSSMREERPRVTVFPNNDFFVVWHQYTGSGTTGYNVRGRVFYGTNPRTSFTINTDTLDDQIMPDVECRNSDTLYVAWMSNAKSSFYDIYCRSYFKYTGLDYGMAAIMASESLLTPDTVGGRKLWYHDNENYDNPATPGWDEDPIPEPESIFVDLEFAMVDQIMELNTNNQYYIICEDTLPSRQFGRALAADAIFLDLGFRTDDATAGEITTTDQSTIVQFISNGGAAMVEGNDFGNMYSGTTLYTMFHAQYLGDGGPYETGNIDTLFGLSGTFARGETLLYAYQSPEDNYPDSIRPSNNGRLILWGTGANDDLWATGHAVGWDNQWKADSGNTLYNTFMLSGVESTEHPHTYSEYYRRMTGFLDMNCQPEPITNMTTTPGTIEGEIKIIWRIVSDDSLLEPANGGYKLKFARAKMTSEVAFSDSSEEYYQQWSASGLPGTQVSQSLYGLPPMDTLIFALKVKDNEGLWDALGDEPRDVVLGDSLTPHSVTVGDNFVKDFMNRYELFDVRSSDSLFMSWDRNNFYVGFSRCKFKTEGDLFVYLDTRTGGADSTVGWSGAAGKSQFGTGFRPDFVFILDDSTNYKLQKYSATKDGRGSWVDTLFNGRCSVDSIVNKYLYSEIVIAFANMRYDTLLGFKVAVLVQSEATNNIWNSYPPTNPVGGTGLFIPYYYFASNGLRSNLVPNRGLSYIGVEETTEGASATPLMTISPNPFHKTTNINIESATKLGRIEGVELKIYDTSGRLVRIFTLPTVYSILPTVVWDGTDQEGRNLPTGVYFCALEFNDQTEMVKAVYIK